MSFKHTNIHYNGLTKEPYNVDLTNVTVKRKEGIYEYPLSHLKMRTKYVQVAFIAIRQKVQKKIISSGGNHFVATLEGGSNLLLAIRLVTI